MLKVALLDDYQRISQNYADWSEVRKHYDVTVFDRSLGVPEEAAEVLAPFDVICLIRERMPFPRALIERLPNLKLISITTRYNRTLDVAAATERRIMVCHTLWRGNAHLGTHELAWGLIHSLTRHLPQEITKMRTGGWQNTAGIVLAGRTLGLIGLGRQGRAMAPVGQAFGMNVIAWSQNLTAEAAAEVNVRRVDKDELFAQSDIVSVHVVLGERTRGLVGARELSLMKSSAFLVNTSRGPIVQESALIEALEKKTIRGAALDVFDREPLPDSSPLRHLPNIMLTPHLGYTVEEFFTAAYEDTVENLVAFAKGQPIRILTADKNFSSPPR